MLTKFFYRFWNFWLRLSEKIRFVLVGGFNTIIAYAIFWILLQLLGVNNYQISLLLSWTFSSVISYSLMRIFVFCSKEGWCSEYFKCVVSWCVSYICNAIILEVAVSLLGWNVYISQALAIAIYTCITYILFKYFAFRHQ
ncbi:MAG: GtrA family protein [Alphaproteobacteria bacterium]|nr:GtrA family protein [Alphaproteobacteria bacterium]